MMRSCRRRDGARRCNRSLNFSAAPAAPSSSTIATTRPRRRRCPWDTRRFLTAGSATRVMLQTRISGGTLSVAHRSYGRVRPQPWSTTSRRRKSAVRCPSFLRRRDRRSGSGSRPRFSQSTAATGAWASTAETTRLRPKTRHASARSVPISPKSSVWPRSLRLSTPPRSFQRWSELSSAAVILDATGRATQMNLPAQDLLGADFYLVRGRPAAHDPASNRRLQQLVSAALHISPGAAQSYPPIVVDRDEAPWLLVEAMPVTAFGSDLFNSGRLILLLTDLRSPLRPSSKNLCAAFGLTAAEAKLATRLASGVGINSAAASVGVSRETARTQLKAVFAKTNTRRQAELAGLLARLRPSES